ncbi:HEAT repeat domain-containing protein [Azospirillum sp. ST 5-10]|uniref:HEAT repeat domain-containing protein n=1 Tax=unclassified Azospirillum TaxID=2630922 RepID=UPI003F4A37D4
MPLVKAGSQGKAPRAVEAEPTVLLASADAAERRQGAHALAGRPEAASILATRLAAEGDAGVREAILTALVRIGTAAAADGLLPLLASEDAALRSGVIESLQQMPPDAVVPRVAPLLDHPDSDLRIFAVQLIAHLVHPDRLARLARVADTDPHVNVCLAAVEGLVETAHPGILPILERLRSRFPDDPMVAFSVDAARRRFQEG